MMILKSNNKPKVTIEEFDEDKITARELLLFLKKDLNMSKTAFDKFCLRYADRDISTIIKYLKKHSDNKVTPKVAVYLKQEIRAQARRIRAADCT